MSSSRLLAIGTMTAISSAFKNTLSQSKLVVCLRPRSRWSRLAPVSQYAIGSCVMTGIRCCARFIVVWGISRIAADFSSTDWTISR